jgi:hypothetical protein
VTTLDFFCRVHVFPLSRFSRNFVDVDVLTVEVAATAASKNSLRSEVAV